MHLFHLFAPSPHPPPPSVRCYSKHTSPTACLIIPLFNPGDIHRHGYVIPSRRLMRSSSQNHTANCFSFLQLLANYNCIALQFCIFFDIERRYFVFQLCLEVETAVYTPDGHIYMLRGALCL